MNEKVFKFSMAVLVLAVIVGLLWLYLMPVSAQHNDMGDSATLISDHDILWHLGTLGRFILYPAMWFSEEPTSPFEGVENYLMAWGFSEHNAVSVQQGLYYLFFGRSWLFGER